MRTQAFVLACIATFTLARGANEPGVGVTGSDSYCVPVQEGAVLYDFSSMPTGIFRLKDSFPDNYIISSPTVDVQNVAKLCPNSQPDEASPAIQLLGPDPTNPSECLDLGLRSHTTAEALKASDPTAGVVLTLTGGQNHPNCDGGRTVVYEMACDASAPASQGPSGPVQTDECIYTISWNHPAACGQVKSGYQCPTTPVPRPTADQLRYIKHEQMALTHFNMATFVRDGDPACDPKNWDNPSSKVNSSDPWTFNPTKLNVSNWIESYKAYGAKHAVLTAKHGCGFLLFNTSTTIPGTDEPYRFGVARPNNGSIQRDVVKEFSEATEAAGLGHGFYYSTTNNYYAARDGGKIITPLLPGQLNITDDQFNDLVFAQLTELWGNYGELTEIWLDHGYAPSQQQRLIDLLKKLQPHTTAFNGYGVSPNPLKWIGTESGFSDPPQWSTGCTSSRGDPTSTTFCPTGADTVLQSPKAWFYVPGYGVRPLSELKTVYHDSVGNNAVLELDFAIDRTGNVDPVQAESYKAFGDWIRNCYGSPVASTSGNTSSLTLSVPSGHSIDRVMMQEMIEYGERVRAYTVESLQGGSWSTYMTGQAIGNKRIFVAKEASTGISAFRLNVTQSVGVPLITNFAAFDSSKC